LNTSKLHPRVGFMTFDWTQTHDAAPLTTGTRGIWRRRGATPKTSQSEPYVDVL
jgi:hypothetical protein